MKKAKITSLLLLLLIMLPESGLPGDDNYEPGPSWYNVKFNGQKVGYYFMELDKIKEGNRSIQVKVEKMYIVLRRMNNELVMDSFLEQRFDEKDNLSMFKTLISEGNIKKKISGTFDYDQGKVVLTIEVNKTEQLQEIDMVEGALSELQVMKEMKKTGLTVGSTMTFTAFLPDSMRFARCKIQIVALEDMYINGENKRLYKVIREVENSPAKWINWLDSGLSPWISEQILPMRVFRTERTNKKDALSFNRVAASDLDIFDNASIKLKSPGNKLIDLEDIRFKTRKVVFKIKNLPAKHMLNGGLQKIISKGGDDSILLENLTDFSEAVKVSGGERHESALKPFLDPNIYIQSENEKIREVVAPLIDKRSRLKTALNIKMWVNKNIEWCTDYGFSTALSTLETRKGDCTEISVLCAALCRNAKIPARIAMGYIIKNSFKEDTRLVPHMWTEILVNNTWYPIDATTKSLQVNPFKIRFLSGALRWDETYRLFNLYANFSQVGVELISTVMK